MKETIFAILVSTIGGIAHYIYDLSKEGSTEKFSYLRFLSNSFLAGFVGYIVYNIIPHDSNIVGFVVGVAGFSTKALLPLIEQFGVKIVEKYLNKKL